MTNPTTQQSREDYYAEIATENMAPLWEVLSKLATKAPMPTAVPAIWHYEKIRDHIMASGDLITAEEAVRRVLILENPGLKGQSKITNALYAGLQLILPGEVAPAHRHSQSALRFVIEGDGAYTAVEGEKTIMRPGDFVITPSWHWHDHGNDSDAPMVWLDGLDIPVLGFFDAGFAEDLDEFSQPLSRPEGDALARYGSGLLPDGYVAPTKASPVFNYPYGRTRDALETMRRSEEWDPCHGLKLQYVNPVDGRSAMPTIATFMQLLPKDFSTAPYRSTDGTIFSVVEGTGTVRIGDQAFQWGPRDTFVIPSWNSYHFAADEDAVLFSFSERPLQQAAGVWRQDRGNHIAP